MNSKHRPVLAALAMLTLAMPALAQSGGGYEVTWSTVDGGGTVRASGGVYAVGGTIGQPDAAVLTGGQYAVHAGFWVDGVGLPAPSPLLPTGEAAKTNRYLRFTAPPPAVGGPVNEVIRIKLVSINGYPPPTTDTLYLGDPQAAPEEDQTQPGLTFTAAPFDCTPFAHDWSADGIISAYGAEIIPASVYEVQRASVDCPNLLNDNGCWSIPLSITTAWFGDVWPPFQGAGAAQPDFNDIAAMVQKFLATGPAAAPIKAVCQLQPNCVVPAYAIGFKDIAADVDAFLGTPYSAREPGPCACPSTVICHSTPCTSDPNCGTGLCRPDGFCGDACGRCTP